MGMQVVIPTGWTKASKGRVVLLIPPPRCATEHTSDSFSTNKHIHPKFSCATLLSLFETLISFFHQLVSAHEEETSAVRSSGFCECTRILPKRETSTEISKCSASSTKMLNSRFIRITCLENFECDDRELESEPTK